MLPSLLVLSACDDGGAPLPIDGGLVRLEDGGLVACTGPALFARSCLNGCHDATTRQSGLDLESDGLAARALNKGTSARPDYLLIDAELPDESALVLKLGARPPFGVTMPLGRAPFTATEIGCVQSWVNSVVAAPDASVGDGDAGTSAADAGGAGDGGGVFVVDAGPFDAGQFWGPIEDANHCVPDGGRWCVVQNVPEPLYAVRGLSATSIWAVGSRGATYHYDGTTWARSDAGTSATLFDVYPVSANDVWAVGEKGLVLRYQAGAWHEVPWSPAPAFPDAGLLPSGQPTYDLGGVAANASEAWFAGSGNTLAHFDGANLRVVRTTSPTQPGADFLRVYRRDDSEWWAVGEAIIKYDGGVANEWATGNGAINRAFGIAGAEHPTTHAKILVTVGADAQLLSFNYADPDNAYPWQPPGWNAGRLELRRDLRSVWLEPLTAHGWAVGLDGEIVEVDVAARKYTRHLTPTHDHLLGTWGTSFTNTWAVGGRSQGSILKSR